MHKRSFFYIILFCLSIIISGCGKKSSTSERPAVPVVSAKTISHDVQKYAETVGCCRSYASVDIIPQVYGTLQRVHFEQGARIKAGDLLYTIDPTRYEAALNLAKAQLTQAEAQLEIDSAKLERSKSLLPQNYISKQEYESLEAQVIQDKAAIEMAKSAIEQANLDFEHCFITSPIDGIAGKYMIDVGNILSQAVLSSSVLVNIQDVDHLYIDFSLSENLFPELYKNFIKSNGELSVDISLVADDSVKGTAKCKFLENNINKHTGSIELRAILDNDEHKFWPGSAINVKMLLETYKDAVLAPAESVKLGQSGYYLFVIKEDKSAELRSIKIGQRYGDWVLIKDGAKAGETVVCTGQLMLAPGMKVVEMPDQRQNQFKNDLKNDKEMSEKNPTTK